MACCSRYTYGIVIGSLYIVASIISLFVSAKHYSTIEYSIHNPQRREIKKFRIMKTLIIWSMIMITSALFIVANVKRYKYMLLPWLLAVTYVFHATCKFMYAWYYGTYMGGGSGVTISILFLIAGLTIVGEFAVFCFSIAQFIKIHKENAELSKKYADNHQLADKSSI